MDEFYSPLRYPGGKGRISDYFKRVFKVNSLYDGVYIEPYAGGASIALSLLFNQYASKVIINDIDRSIYAFWYSAINQTERFCKSIYDAPLNVTTWLKQKNIQKNKKDCGLLTLGFSTFYLNRTSRSGIIGAGVIGGYDQMGRWKIDARFNKSDLVKRIERIALFANRIELYNIDALKLLKKLRYLPNKSIYYFDPPYYSKGRELYLNFYEPADHANVAKSINDIDSSYWIVTYDDELTIKNLYKKYRKIHYQLNYSVANSTKNKELMIFSNNLIVPKTRPDA